ncbi:MAG: hypothetical protein WC455_12880 [Dehalococcoidia bacterium]|jgi:hypothetical protein
MTDFRDAFLIAWYAFLIALICPAIMAANGQVSMEISGNASGIGIQEHSVEAAGQLIESVHDALPNKRSWAMFLLESHGYETDGKSLMWVNGTRYEIAENGSIEAI